MREYGALLFVVVAFLLVLVYGERTIEIGIIAVIFTLLTLLAWGVYRAIRQVPQVVDELLRGVRAFTRFRPYHSAGIDQLRTLPPEEYRRFVQYVLEREGYHLLASFDDELVHARVVHKDKRNSTCALHVRHNHVRFPMSHVELAAIYGACERCDGAVVVSSAGFTARARAWARAHTMTLIDERALMRCVWHGAGVRLSLFEMLTKPSLVAPERVLSPPFRAQLPAHERASDQQTQDNERCGCAKFWPELCAK